MAELLPLFPLGTVLYPGMVLPLHVFEERYRRMVRDLLEGPPPRTFGVVAIRHGRETGDDGVTALHEIGCTAIIREVTPRSDGRYNLTTVGGDRFRLLSQDRSLPYLRGSVEFLPDQVGEPAAVPAVAPVRAAFRDYLAKLSERAGPAVTINDIPDEPVLLSYVIAAAMIIDLPERQQLLEAPGALDRLGAERDLLRREIAILRVTGTRPAPDFRHTPYSSNLTGSFTRAVGGRVRRPFFPSSGHAAPAQKTVEPQPPWILSTSPGSFRGPRPPEASRTCP